MRSIERGPFRSTSMADRVQLWYAEFIDEARCTKDELFELLLAANYLDIETLLNLTGPAIASRISGKSMSFQMIFFHTNVMGSSHHFFPIIPWRRPKRCIYSSTSPMIFHPKKKPEQFIVWGNKKFGKFYPYFGVSALYLLCGLVVRKPGSRCPLLNPPQV